MKRITATLPALGSYVIQFYKESSEVLDFLGEKEIRRLDLINHLGITSKVFTGVNHSRWEYTLLQCAFIHLLPQFHRGHEQFAISGQVRLAGTSHQVSSGEELLKCWALLGNSGHCRYTFAVERSLLQQARRDPQFRKVLIHKGIQGDLRRWVQRVIDEYRDEEFHYLLALIRICNLPEGSRLKGRLRNILRHLLVPLNELHLPNRSDRYKLYRLRRLYQQVRLLCLVTLDAYYSHHPVRYQLSSALMNLSNLVEDPEQKSGFVALLENTAAWLADELYLHPNSTAAQRQYEIMAERKFRGVYRRRIETEEAFRDFFGNFMQNGFGQPLVTKLRPLARLTFPEDRFKSLDGRDRDPFQLLTTTEAQLTDGYRTRVSLALNPYSRMIHLDLLYDQENSTPTDIARMYGRVYIWLSRAIEARVLQRIRSLTGRSPGEVPEENIARIRVRMLAQEMHQSEPLLRGLFEAIIQYLLPEHVRASVAEYIPLDHRDQPILLRFNYVRGDNYDTLSSKLDTILSSNPTRLTEDRLHELRALQYLVMRSKYPLVMACTEQWIIRDESGRDLDDWDGVLMEVSDSRVLVTIVEAKNRRTRQKSENEAFQQLAHTRDLIRSKRQVQSRRQRIPGFGARLTVSLA